VLRTDGTRRDLKNMVWVEQRSEEKRTAAKQIVSYFGSIMNKIPIVFTAQQKRP
jgi:hypothetical protein